MTVDNVEACVAMIKRARHAESTVRALRAEIEKTECYLESLQSDLRRAIDSSEHARTIAREYSTTEYKAALKIVSDNT